VCVDRVCATGTSWLCLSGWVGWHSQCLKSSWKVYRECTSAGLCVTSFNAPYPSAAKQPRTSLESTLPLSIQAFPCIPQLPFGSALSQKKQSRQFIQVLFIHTGIVCQAAVSPSLSSCFNAAYPWCRPVEPDSSEVERKTQSAHLTREPAPGYKGTGSRLRRDRPSVTGEPALGQRGTGSRSPGNGSRSPGTRFSVTRERLSVTRDPVLGHQGTAPGHQGTGSR